MASSEHPRTPERLAERPLRGVLDEYMFRQLCAGEAVHLFSGTGDGIQLILSDKAMALVALKGPASRKGTKGFLTKNGHRTVGEDIQALMENAEIDLLRFQREAERRNRSKVELAADILETVTAEDLFAAVLDD